MKILASFALLTLTWLAVTKNVDGTAATITGYRIYRGDCTAALAAIATVAGSVLKYTDNPKPGNYCWAVTALSATAESDRSAIVSYTVRLPAPRGGIVLPAPKGGIVLPTP